MVLKLLNMKALTVMLTVGKESDPIMKIETNKQRKNEEDKEEEE